MARADEQRARHYARAFLLTLLEMKGEGILPKIDAELRDLAPLVEGEGGSFFESPVFDTEEKFSVLDAYLSGHPSDPTVGRFFKLLITERQVGLFPLIAAQYSEVLREQRNEAKATVTTAFPLGAGEKERLAKALGKATGHKILLDVAVDPNLIGGIVAEVGGTVFDASIRGYLDRLREEF